MIDKATLTLTIEEIERLPREARLQIIIVDLLRRAGWDGNLAADCPICKAKTHKLPYDWMYDLRHEDNCPVKMYDDLTQERG